MRQLLLLFAICSLGIIQAQNYNFLGSYTSNGTPLYLTENDDVSVETLELIDSSLPESYPVPDYNPHYISSGYDTDIKLEDAADVWVTFVSEGAGYRNVLGFYTYDLNNPSDLAPEPEDITIIFPNVSALGSGGGLETGNKVKIGSFEAGTGIGWVLLANAWNGQRVTSGYWQLYSNPNYNPENDPDLKYHNVLLQDSENERVILGFEDIRRDHGSCDNDFNDAVFYITASNFEAMDTDNFADVDSSTDIYSANDGGLESNGDLASLIAKRNFKRAKDNSALNKKITQSPYRRSKSLQNSLAHYLPQTGMFNTEISYVSSPDDLLEITNAVEVFSVDYYQNDKRVSAALATKTVNEVYNHSKMICDRLNGAQLKDVRNVNIQGYEVIYSVLEHLNGNIEYAVSFSVKNTMDAYELYSRWNIDEYPEGDYLNFQFWGSSMGQTAALANEVIRLLKSEKRLVKDIIADRIPNVFMKSGTYKNGKLELTLINKIRSNSVVINANVARNEYGDREQLSFNVPLSDSKEQKITVPVGFIFDAGISLIATGDARHDSFYLADGPWGVDYIENEATVTVLDNLRHDENFTEGDYIVERGINVEGEVKGTLNVFRNLLSGDKTLNVEEYNSVAFDIENNLPVEVILVTKNLTDWNQRLRYTIPTNEEKTRIEINFEDFLSQSNKSTLNDSLRSIVFSIQGDYSTSIPFSIDINRVTFNSENILSVEEEVKEDRKSSIYMYPNPFKTATTIVLPKASKYAKIMIVDMLGRVVLQRNVKTTKNNTQIELNEIRISTGMYKYILVDDKTRRYTGSFLID